MAVEKYPLNPILTPINYEERQKILENWQRITRYFNSVEGQIKLLAGGKEIEELLQGIELAITNAQNVTTSTQIALNNVVNALAQLNAAISNANTATNRANAAADDANTLNIALTSLKGHLETLQNDLTGIVQAETQRVTNEGNRVQAEDVRVNAESLRNDAELVRKQSEVIRNESEDLRGQNETVRKNAETERTNVEQLRIDKEAERIENESLRISAEDNRSDVEQERFDAEIIREQNEVDRVGNENVRGNNENERLQAETERIDNEVTREQNEQLRKVAYVLLTELLQNMESLAYDYEETYNFPNFVSYNGSTFIALKEVQGITPINDSVNYRLVAQRGVDGTGAVSSVNGMFPDDDGDVTVEIQLINVLTSTATDAALTAAQGRVLKLLFDTHASGKIASETGIHGVRYFEEKLEIDIDGEWVEISTGGALNVPNVSNFIGASATDGNAINVSWVNPTNAEFKRVEMYVSTSDISNVKIGDIANVATRIVNDASTSYTHPTSHGEQVYFKIFAVHEMVGDRYSEGLAINVVAVDTEAPGNVKNIHVANDNGKFTLSWVNPTDADLNKVKVVMNESDYPTSDTDGTVIYEGTGASVTVENLTNDQPYYIRFFVSDIIGNMNSSTEMQTVATPVDIRGVSGLTVQSNLPGTQFTLNWTNPTDATYVKTEVYASTSDLSTKTRQQCAADATLIYSGTGATTTHVTTPNQTYYFKVFAEHSVNGVTRFDSGVGINKQAIDTEPPSTITNFVAKGSDASVLLTWANPTDTDFQKVVIRYKQGSYPTSSTDGQLAYDGSATTTSVTGLTNDVVYYFRAFAFDVNGNVNSTTTNQQITATPSSGDDTTGSPGPKKLIGGTMQAGYFGRVAASELFTGPELALAVGIAAGTAQHDNTDWLKFAYQGKILFRPMKAIRHTISWDNINGVGCVFGTKTVAKNGLTYKVRLMKASTVDPATTANDATNTMKNSEWNKLMLPIHEQAATKTWSFPNFVESDVPNWGVGFTDADLLMNSSLGNGSALWCQETSASNMTTVIFRGDGGVSSASNASISFVNANMGWCPVLELVQGGA